MVKTLERALAEVAKLPEAAQERIGQDLLAYLQRLQSLRDTLDASIARGGSYTDEQIEDGLTERLDAWERQGK